ncbi:MAG: hypothetical protein Q4D51_13540 [Eubacteriales bacterium]|nr:hypothetical protein [Eubacteriales bacterium]
MRIIYVVLVFCMCCLCISGCSSMDTSTETNNDSITQNMTTGTGSDNTTEEDMYVADAMSSEKENNKSFYIMRVKDDYLEIPGECKCVYIEGDAKYPELEDGQIAYVTADVTIIDGGEAGYMRNIFIDKLISCEQLEYSDICQTLEISDIHDLPFAYANHMLRYIDGDKYYLCVLNRQYIEVYENGMPYMEYDYNEIYEQNESIMSPLYEKFPEQE